jgi:hypothetical protein
VLKDPQGRVSGFVAGKLVNGIPGVRIQQTLASQNWNGATEPTYLVPKDTEITATLDGSALSKPDKGDDHPDRRRSLRRGRRRLEERDRFPGWRDRADLPHPGSGSDPDHVRGDRGEGNLLRLHRDRARRKGRLRSDRVLREGHRAFALATEGSGGTGEAQYVLVGIRSTDQGDSTWSTDSLHISQGQLAVVLYRQLPARNREVPVYTATASGDTITSSKQTLQPDNG